MGTLIRASGVHSEPVPMASITCSARAAERCLAAAGLPTCDVDLLISTGVYRENNLAEPALAALIQREIGANPDPFIEAQGKRTFAFDLMNGPVGVLNAVQVADAMVTNGRYRNVLVVSNDVHPSVVATPGFPFVQVGTAMLLSRSEASDVGFRGLSFRTSAHTDQGFRGRINFNDDCGDRAPRSFVRIDVEPGYVARLRAFTVRTVREYLREHLEGATLTHVVCSRPTASFGEEVVAELALPGGVVVCDGVQGDAHSSYLAAAFHLADARRAFRRGDTVLFIGAGAGLTCGCGLYRV